MAKAEKLAKRRRLVRALARAEKRLMRAMAILTVARVDLGKVAGGKK